VGPRRRRLRPPRSGEWRGGGDDSRHPLQCPHVRPKGRSCSGQSSVSASVSRGLSPGGASTSTARAWRARLK